MKKTRSLSLVLALVWGMEVCIALGHPYAPPQKCVRRRVSRAEKCTRHGEMRMAGGPRLDLCIWRNLDSRAVAPRDGSRHSAARKC